jgi:hypothetical protein
MYLNFILKITKVKIMQDGSGFGSSWKLEYMSIKVDKSVYM